MSLRRVFRSTTAWAFGFSVTILFIALWGRAVVVDTDTLSESLRPLSGSSAVVDLFGGWITDELVNSGYQPEIVDPAVGYMLDSSATADALDRFVVEVVDAAASSDPAGSSVDMSGLLAPAVPEMTAGLNGVGISADTSDVASLVSDLDPLVIRESGATSIVGPSSPTAARLGTAVLLAILGMVTFGYFSVVSSEDRIAAVRGLFSRVAIGGFGFAMLLLIGSWITDPNGGRAPVAESVSALTGSKWLLPLQVGIVAAVVAASIYVTRRWLRPGEESHSTDEPPTPPEERELSLSGSR